MAQIKYWIAQLICIINTHQVNNKLPQKYIYVLMYFTPRAHSGRETIVAQSKIINEMFTKCY